MKYVICVPDGCADLPVPELDGRTPLEVAHTPVLDALAARATVGRAAVIPEGMPPGSDVGNMSILGFDPTEYHTGRAPIEVAAMGRTLRPDQTAFRCNLVVVHDGVMVDYAGANPTNEEGAAVVAALQEALAGAHEGLEFLAGVGFRNALIAPEAWLDADCTPPHDLSGAPIVNPSGPAGEALTDLMISREEEDIYTEKNRELVVESTRSVADRLVERATNDENNDTGRLTYEELYRVIEKVLVENDAYDVAKSLVFSRSNEGEGKVGDLEKREKTSQSLQSKPPSLSCEFGTT